MRMFSKAILASAALALGACTTTTSTQVVPIAAAPVAAPADLAAIDATLVAVADLGVDAARADRSVDAGGDRGVGERVAAVPELAGEDLLDFEIGRDAGLHFGRGGGRGKADPEREAERGDAAGEKAARMRYDAGHWPYP